MFGRIQKCIEGANTAFEGIKAIFGGLKDKFDTLKTEISLNLPGTVIWAIDILFAMLCEHSSLLKALKQLAAGLISKNNNHKYYLFGKALGTLLKTIANAESFAGKILKK